jgi:hypothetical protein
MSLAAMVFCTLAALWDPVYVLESRVQLGFRGLVLMLIGTLFSLHPYFAPWAAVPLMVDISSAAWAQRDPTLESHLAKSILVMNVVLCLSVMDLFVWIRHFSSLGVRYIVEADFPEITSRVFEKAGRSLLVSLICRVVLIETMMFFFFYGAFLEATFRVRSVVFANVMLQFGQFPYLMVCEAQRIKAGVRRKASPFKPTEATLEGLLRPSPQSHKIDRFSRVLVKLEVKLALVAASVALCYGCFFALERKGPGYSLSAFASKDDNDKRRTLGMFERQGTFPVTLMFTTYEGTVPADDVVPYILELFDDISHTPRTRPDFFPAELKNLTWMPPYSSQDWGSFVAQYPFDRENDHVRNAVIASDMIKTLGIPGICSGDGDPAVTYEYFNRWPALFRKPYLDSRCVAPFEGRFSHLYNESLGQRFPGKIWRDMADLPLLYSQRVPMYQSLYYMKFYITGVTDDEDIMHAVRTVSAVLRASKFDDGSLRHWQIREREDEPKADVAVCGPTYTQYKGLEGMEDQLMFAFHFVFIVQFIFCWIFLGFRLAAAHMFSLIMLTLEIWGVSMFFVKLNVFSLAGMAMTMNLAPIFSSDLTVAVKENPELPPDERIKMAMRAALPPMWQGALCTLGTLLPLFGSPFPLIRQSFAVPALITVLLGTLHGSIISPAFLALLAQNELTPMKALEDSECVGVAVEVPALHGGPNLLQSAATDQLDKSK